MKLPSKKILLVLVACIGAVAIVLFATRMNASPAVETPVVQKNTPAVIDVATQNTATLDSDNDGLKDWEEVLWNTDPHKADSNDNGITDGEEIALKKTTLHDTPIADATSAEEKKTTQSTPTGPLTLTDQLARNAFNAYVSFKQAGGTVDATNAQDIAQSILSNNPLTQQIPKFSTQHLTHIIDNETSDDIHTYGNELWDVMVRNTPTGEREDEFSIFLSAVQKERPQDLAKLDPIITGYENTIRDLLAMNVPRGAVSAHLALINQANIILGYIQDMRGYFEDSARGLGALMYYRPQSAELEKAFTAIISYLSNQGVAYVEGDGGYALVHSI